MTRRARFGYARALLTLVALAACDGKTSADSARSSPPGAPAPAFTAPPGSMPLLSRTIPATASSSHAAWAQDATYAAFAPDHMWTCKGDCWLAYDLSTVPEQQRSTLLVALFFGGNVQYQLNVHALGGVDLRGLPTGGYRLEGATSGAGPWTTLVTVAPLAQASRVHRVDFRGYSWLRYAASESTKLKMDVYSAAEGVPDGLLLAGDSIANMQCVGLPQSWFATGVAQRAPGRFPPMVGGGIAFTTAVNGRDLLVTGKGDFTKEMGGPILELLQGLPWLGLTFGTNDAAPGPSTNEEAFLKAYADIIRAALGRGMRVAIATATWAPDPNRQDGLKRLNGRIGLHPRTVPDWTRGSFQPLDHVWNGGKVYRCSKGGTSVTGPSGRGRDIADGGSARWEYLASLRELFAAEVAQKKVVAGPDLYSLFKDQPGWIADGVHPNPTGSAEWRKAWVDWALATMYP
jgi:lysophospholipase L1-like esterase